MTIPHGVSRYITSLPYDCKGWRGRKFYGRPVWFLWLQRAIWEDAYGPLTKGERVNQLCETIGCLELTHLTKREKLSRIPKTICRHCGGILSRDKSEKTYCVLCMRTKARKRRAAAFDKYRQGQYSVQDHQSTDLV